MADGFYMQYAAHVHHEVTHDSVQGTLTLAAGGLALGIIIVIMNAPGAITMEVILDGVSTTGMTTWAGRKTGGLLDDFSAGSTVGEIVSGLETVHLGPDGYHAARAKSEDTKTSCPHKAMIAEGSKTVTLGPECKPMSRRADRLLCGHGAIKQGLESLAVGGLPTMYGKTIEKQDEPIIKFVDLLIDMMTLPKELSWKLGVEGVGVGLEAGGQEDPSKIALAPKELPTSALGAWKFYSDSNDAVQAGAHMVTPSSGGSE